MNAADLVELPAKKKSAEELEEWVDKVETRNGFTVSIQTAQHIEDAREAMLHAGLDPDIWEAVKVRIRSYQVTIKDNDGNAQKRQMFAVGLECRRRFEEPLQNAVENLAKRVHRKSFKWPAVSHRKPKKDPSTLVVSLHDHHWGKLAYKPETGSAYDLKIAKELWTHAIRSAIRRCESVDLAQIILPVGSDLLHVDTRSNTTEGGTPQDMDTRYEKMLEHATEALILAVRELREHAPVLLPWVSGNHDRTSSLTAAMCARWAFEGDKNVTVDTEPDFIKYVHFGRCLIAMTHGDSCDFKKLMQLMPVDRPEEWAKAVACREVHTGHRHHRKTIKNLSTDEQAGIMYRILPSLSGVDAWHRRSGYSMSLQATTNLLYSHEWGITAEFTESADRLLGRKP